MYGFYLLNVLNIAARLGLPSYHWVRNKINKKIKKFRIWCPNIVKEGVIEAPRMVVCRHKGPYSTRWGTPQHALCHFPNLGRHFKVSKSM